MLDPSSRAHAPHLTIRLRRLLAVGSIAALALAVAGPPAAAAASTGVGHRSTVKITKVHQTHLARKTGTDLGEGADPETGPRQDEGLDAQAPGSQKAKRVPATGVPTPPSLALTGNGGAAGWDGQTHADQRLAGTGIYANTNFSSEPPDMGLCVGAGFVVQAINSSIQAWTSAGSPLTAPTPLNQLFGALPAIDRTDAAQGIFHYGDDIGDVKCYFDPDTQRWFVSAFRLRLDPDTGANPTKDSHVVLAVSSSSNPASATWTVWDLDTTNGDGSTAGHPNCPCLGDQPLIGADHYGFYISTNEYSLVPFGANGQGTNLYAFNKLALATGAGGTLTGVHFSNIPLDGTFAFEVQPATTPAGGSYELRQSGTEYFLSSLDENGKTDNRIAVWALTGTSTLGGSNAVTLTSKLLTSEVYGFPPDAEQKNGPTPLKDAEAAGLEGRKSLEHLELIASNDDRIYEVKYAGGVLWSDLNTSVKNANGNVNAGIAWFAVTPSISSAGVGGAVTNQGYVAVNRLNTLFGAIAANNRGDAAMGFTIVGPDMYPSVGWVSLGSHGATSAVHISASGVAPEDGFSGYVIEGGAGTARWGDYSAATADEAGNLWLANQYIPDAPRTLFANYGTHITMVTP